MVASFLELQGLLGKSMSGIAVDLFCSSTSSLPFHHTNNSTMAPPKTDVKKKLSRRSRKARMEGINQTTNFRETEHWLIFAVSSSSSEASSDSDSSASDSESEKTSKPAVKAASKARENLSPSPEEESATTVPVQASKAETEQAFESFYLRQAAKEFSDDLDKLRGASDFKGQSSVELLVGALKQGGACFSPDERSRVGGGGASAK